MYIHYAGNPDSDEVDLAIVGKGVTYDTGGLNIKLALIEKMHGDKGGSTAVLGALRGCLDLKLKKNVIFCCGFAENAISSGSYKPGDIIRGMNGLSVSIGNTDAEGRLVMSDTATYAQRNFKPKRLIYIATLTGAAPRALGTQTGAVFGHDEDMIQVIKDSAVEVDEPIWHMPLIDEHRQAMAGKFGNDLDNLGSSPWGGSCTAAAFLERFIENDIPWAHLDIAGPAVMDGPDCNGYGAKLLLGYIKNMTGSFKSKWGPHEVTVGYWKNRGMGAGVRM